VRNDFGLFLKTLPTGFSLTSMRANRSIPDENLDDFVNRFAANISNFDREYIASVKQITGDPMNSTALYPVKPTQSDFFVASEWSERREQIATPLERRLHEQGDWKLVPGEDLRPE
jgi:hypothetical protein